MADNMAKIDVNNNINYVNELLGVYSTFVDSDVLEILKMLKDKKPKKISMDDYKSIYNLGAFYKELGSNLHAVIEYSHDDEYI
jgi:hypothetical protein